MKQMLRWLFLLALASLMMGTLAYATTIDLSGAATGTLIVAPGGSFASTFQGQTIVGGTGISGDPTNPLTLKAGNVLDIEFWTPNNGSPAGNSILPEPGNQGTLSILLDSSADTLSWTMGFGNPPSSIGVDFFDITGALVHSATIDIIENYNVYSAGGFGAFRGLTFYNDNDPGGLRFMDFSYSSRAVPEPTSLLLIGSGLAWIGLAAWRRKK